MAPTQAPENWHSRVPSDRAHTSYVPGFEEGVVPFPRHWPGTRGGGARALYYALTGLPEAGRDGIPRALPWAVLFRPVGAFYLPSDLPAAGLRQAGQALKGRLIIAQGNALGAS